MKTSNPLSYHSSSEPKLFPKIKLACVIFLCFKIEILDLNWPCLIWAVSKQENQPVHWSQVIISYIIPLSDPYHPAVKWTTQIKYQKFYCTPNQNSILDYRFKHTHFLRKMRLRKDLFFFLAPWPMFCLSPSIGSTFSGLEGRADAVSKPADCSLEICSAGPK